MGNYIPLIVATFLYISLFVYLIANTQIDNLRREWNTVRCQPIAMMFASYIPDPNDTTVNRSKFSSDNFQFCIQEIIDSSIKLFMTPVMSLFSNQLMIGSTIQTSINNLRNSAASDMAHPFNAIVNLAWKKFGYIMQHIFRIVFKLNSSFQRIFGIALSSIFAGLSVFTAINNSIKFFVKVSIIILIIIISMIALLFIPLSPIIPVLIIPTIAIIASVDSNSGISADAFTCVKPGTLVKMGDGWKKVEDIRLGDQIWEGTVEGILYGKGGESVSIHSVTISILHIVFDEKKGEWVFAKDHSDAIPCDTPAYVYSLVTSSRTWTVKGDAEILLRDWTHSTGDPRVEKKISSLLKSSFVSKGMGLVGPKSHVWKEGVGPVPLSSIRIGDRIKCIMGFTEVTSIYHSAERGNSRGPNTSAWILDSTGWIQREVAQDSSHELMHVGTGSGTLLLDGMYIRDVNEIEKKDFTELEHFLLSLLTNRND